jgi:hypothetical protein
MRSPLRRDHWVPPLPLVAGLAFQAAAWVIVILYAAHPSPGLAFAWVHAVALGWVTIVALAILIHVVPAFTDLAWRGERLARDAVMLALFGAVALVVSFAADATRALAIAGGVVFVAIGAYVAAALRTLAQRAEDETSAAIAGALRLTLGALALTVLLGAMLAGAYASGNGALLSAAPAHAILGIGAWLSVLVNGVSARTFRPMLGARSRLTAVHIVSGTSLFVGSLVAAVGVVTSVALARVGIVIVALGALCYAIDAFDILRRATTPHPPVRGFVASSVIWLLVAAAALVGAAWGAPVAAVAVVAALAGWIGQMVNAHLHHIGVRVAITLLRGEEDETRPWEVLDRRLSWAAFAFGQLAVLATVVGIATGNAATLAAAGGCGLVAIGAMAANAVTLRRRASTLPIVL